MKHVIILFFFVTFFASCKNGSSELGDFSQQVDSAKIDTSSVASIQADSLIKFENFKTYSSRAILIGDRLDLLDVNEKLIKDISNKKESFVKVIAKSTKLNHYKNVNKSDCNEYYWVKIIVDGDTGYIDGNRLYEPYKHSQNKTYKIGSDEIEITMSKTMGQREFDEMDDALYCFSAKPIIFRDKKSNYEGLVELKSNKFRVSEFDKYFCLHDDDGTGDEVKKVELINNKYVLSILRGFQEGGAKMVVEIYKTELNKFIAEIVEFKEVDEDEYQKLLKP